MKKKEQKKKKKRKRKKKKKAKTKTKNMSDDSSLLNRQHQERPSESSNSRPVSSVVQHEAKAERIIIVERDYSEGEMCKFSLSYPSQLEGKMDKQTFEKTLSEINSIMKDAEELSWPHFWESCLGYVTCFSSYIFITTYYTKVIVYFFLFFLFFYLQVK